MRNEIRLLKKYFNNEEDVVMAYLYGSYSKGLEIDESDVDIAVYLKKDGVQIENIWSDVIRIVERTVDLVDLKKASATLISNIIKTGIPLTIKDKGLYWRVYLQNSLEAEDFYYFSKDYLRIYKNARSLIPEEKTRLFERVQFLEGELEEIEGFRNLSLGEYQDDKFKRRNIERWTENILNATIDIAKIVLASEKRKMPKTYELALIDFVLLVGFNEDEAKKFSYYSNLRNLLAHEYLDVLHKRIQEFISQAPYFYKNILVFLEKYLGEK